jgi:hypothetical protein
VLSENNIISARGAHQTDPAGRVNEAQPSSFFLNMTTFLIPALKFVEINLVGSLYLSDLLLAALFCILLFRRRSFTPLNSTLTKKFLIYGSMWFVAQIVTDIVRQTPFEDFARGWARIVVTLLHFSVLYILLHDQPRRILIYGWGLVVGSILAYFFNPFVFAAEYPWESGWAFPVTLAVFLVASDEQYPSLILPIAIGVINIYLGYRSMGATCFLVAIYLFLRLVSSRSEAWRLSLRKPKYVALAVALVALGIWSMANAYQKAASSGLLGEAAQWKYEFQSSGEYGLLLGGRSEIMLGFLAIYDSPLLGHGSWAKNEEYVAAYRAMMLLLGYNPAAFQRGKGTGIDSQENDNLIVAHSHILGAWVEAGIVGGLFFVWILVLAARSLKRLFTARIQHAPLVVFYAFWLMWNLCFEPYGGDKRFTVLYFVVVLTSYATVLSERTASSPGLSPALSTAR